MQTQTVQNGKNPQTQPRLRAAPTPVPIATLVADAMDDAKDDKTAARAALYHSIRTQPKLWEQYQEDALQALVDRELNAIVTESRYPGALVASCRLGANGNGNGGPPIPASEYNPDRYLMFRLHGGKRLGDATRDEVDEQEQIFRTHSETSGHNSRWFKEISNRLPTCKSIVKKVLKGKMVETLFKKTE
jgi:hypothetical protein